MAIFEIDIPGLIRDVSDDDLKFLRVIKVRILENLSNPRFGSNELAISADLSLPQLSRRFKLLTHYTPNRMIKYFRMEYAMVLLIETRMSVKEIAVNTGFWEQANFTRTFKQHFGRSPSSVREAIHGKAQAFTYQCQTPLRKEDIKYMTWLSKRDTWFNDLLTNTIANIHNEHFNPNTLASLLSLSTAQLNRKLKSLLNITAGRFIKNIRLQQAAELLAYEEKPVGAVAYQTGFFDHPHFCRVFKEAYQCPPKVFRNRPPSQDLPRFIKAFSDLNKIDK